MNAGVLLWARCERRRRWGALALLVVLVSVGGGATIAAAAAARRTDTAFGRMLQVTNEPNLSVQGVNEEGFFDLDPGLLDRVMQIDGVKAATEFAWMAVAPDGFPNYFALALVDWRGETSHPVRLEGVGMDEINTLGADQVLMNESMRNQLGLGVGKTVGLESLTAEQFVESLSEDTEVIPKGPAMDVRIAGIGRSLQDVSDAPDPFLVFPPAFYDKYHDSIGSCRCDVLINADPEAIDAVVDQLAGIYPSATIERQEDFAGRIADTVALQRRTWWLIALAAAVAGSVVLLQASMRVGRIVSAGDDTRRALGMTQRETLLGRLLVIGPPVVLGTALALGLAYALSPLAPVGLTRLAEPSPGLRWEAGVVLPGVLIVLVVSLVVAGAAVVAPRRRIKRRDRVGRLGGPQLALGSRLALGPGRGAIIGVLISTAGLVGAVTLQHSLDHVLATPALYGADFDAGNFLDSRTDKRALGEAMTSDPDIAAVGLVWTQSPTESPVHVVGPRGAADVGPNAYENMKGTLSIKLTRGRTPNRADEVAVGRAVLDQLGVQVGDRITATSSKATMQLTIVGDNLDPGVDVAGNGFAMTLDGLVALTDPEIGGTVVRFAPGTDHAAILERYSALDLTPVVPPSEVGHIGQLGGLPGRVGQLLTLLGLAALLNSIVLTLRAARREIALHRALGFTSAQVVGVHLLQGAITAITGVVIGGGIGFVVGRAIDRQLVGNVGAIAQTVLPGVVWLVALGAIVACLCGGVITSAIALRHSPSFELRAE